MIPPNLILTLSTLALFSGCGVNDPRLRVTLDQMNAEIMAVEDRYYDLEYKYQIAQQQLAACQGNSGSPAGADQDCQPGYEVSSRLEYVPQKGHSIPLEHIDGRRMDVGNPESILPGIGVPDDADDASLNGELNIEFETSSYEEAIEGPGTVTEVVLQPLETGGTDYDGDSIDDGIQIALLPQDAAGRPVNVPGKVIISLIDPLLAGQEQRVGLWEFTQEEILEAITEESKGIWLSLPWQAVPPRNNNLKLFVRYLTADNQRLETSMEVLVNTAENRVRPKRLRIASIQQEKPVAQPIDSTGKRRTSDHEMLAPPATVFVPDEPVAAKTASAEIEWKPTR